MTLYIDGYTPPPDTSKRYHVGIADDYTAAQIENAAHTVNTTGKAAGRLIWDSTNNRVMVATGSAATAVWNALDGSTSITPTEGPLAFGANLAGWWDASDLATITKNGSNQVSAWNDKSGNARHMSNVGTVTYNATSLGGFPAMVFNGAGEFQSPQEAIAYTKFAIFAVAILATGAPVFGRIFTYSPDGVADYQAPYTAMLTRDNNNTGLQAYRDAILSVKSIPALDVKFHASSVFDGTNSTIRVGNVAGTSVAHTAAMANVGASRLRVGGRGTGGDRWSGSISEVLLVDLTSRAALSADELLAMSNYFIAKWGL